MTVAAVLDQLAKQRPALERRVHDELGRTRVHVNLFVGDDNIRDLDGAATDPRRRRAVDHSCGVRRRRRRVSGRATHTASTATMTGPTIHHAVPSP